MHYDLVVIGTGPSGQKGAIAAAKMGKKVAIVERNRACVGGVCLHTGTVPSKTIREAILFLTGYRQKEVYGERYSQKRHITMDDLRKKLSEVVERERRVIFDQLERNFIDIYEGDAAFVGENEIDIASDDRSIRLTTDYTLLATGSKPHRPSHVPFDGQTVFDSDEILTIKRIPRSMVVIGGGVIGIEYGIMFAALGVKITVVDGQEQLLNFCDREIVDHLMFTARSLGITFRTGESVRSVKKASRNRVIVELESQKKIVGETAFFSVGRKGDTEFLNPAAAGVELDKRERIVCNKDFETSAPSIFAVGDVIGFPALASTSMEQGRQAASRIFQHKSVLTGQIPYGLFTIPEIAMVGKTEQELTAEKVPFEIGVSRFEELAKSQICGGNDGLLKLLFHRETRKILGVHCIGDTGTEIIHIGQTVMAFDGTIDYLADAIFNHPTMAESYKVAAFDGLNRLCADEDEGCFHATPEVEEHEVGEEESATPDSEISESTEEVSLAVN
jgi:NAD(P) transhydrogenase